MFQKLVFWEGSPESTTDVARSAEFYSRVFGGSIRQRRDA